MVTDNRFYDEILKLQMQLFILEMWDIFMDQLERHNRTLQSGTLYERFVHLLELHCMKNREVQFYSDQLHITAKYLNQICKTNTGITASIDAHGRVDAILPPHTAGILPVTVQGMAGLTPYTRSGDAPLLLLSGLLYPSRIKSFEADKEP